MPPITPGAYIKMRRCAAMLSPRDLAERLATDPATPVHLRAEQIELIEADVQPYSPDFPAALKAIIDLDLEVVERLEAIRDGLPAKPPQLCRICACSEYDACRPRRGGPCGWAEVDLCTSCTPESLAALGLAQVAA